MTMLSKEVFANNLKRYMDIHNMTQREMAEVVGVSTPTVNEWLKAKKFPRIDKIEIISNHFGIAKSELIEEKNSDLRNISWEKTLKKNDTLADIVVKLRTDDDFSVLVEKISKFDDKQLERLRTYVAFLKDFQD